MTGRTRPLHRIRSAPSRRSQFRTGTPPQNGPAAADPHTPTAATGRQLALFQELVERSVLHCLELRRAHETLLERVATEGAHCADLQHGLARASERRQHAEQSHRALVRLLEEATASAAPTPGDRRLPLLEIGEAAP
jgi:hypothetical protein